MRAIEAYIQTWVCGVAPKVGRNDGRKLDDEVSDGSALSVPVAGAVTSSSIGVGTSGVAVGLVSAAVGF